jgi:alkanesulfonate monooxygenase SsuD/methylene tetrahydromethanopterin reductase-like flavin-dependent oxidoreductase (luciferase family)
VSGLRYGVHLPTFADPGALVELGVLISRMAGTAAFCGTRSSGLESPMPIADPWMVLGALAVRTERIRLGTAVTPQPRRPQKLAREAVTLDHLSGRPHGAQHGPGGPPDAEYARSVRPTTRGSWPSASTRAWRWRPPVVGASGSAIAGATSAPTR